MMMKSEFLITLLLVALFVAAAPLRGEPSQPGALSVDFSTLLWAGQSVPYEVYFLDAQGRPQPVALQSSRRSRVETYRGPGPLIFVRKEQALGADAQELLHEVGRVELSADMSRILVLFAAQTQAGRLNVVALDDRPEHFPGGSYKLINVTGSALDVHCGEQVLTLDGGGQRVWAPEHRGGDNAVAVAVHRAQSASTLFSGVWPHFPPLRTLVFFYTRNDSGDNGVDVFIVSDVVAQ